MPFYTKVRVEKDKIADEKWDVIKISDNLNIYAVKDKDDLTESENGFLGRFYTKDKL